MIMDTKGEIECHLKAKGAFAMCVFACMCVCTRVLACGDGCETLADDDMR